MRAGLEEYRQEIKKSSPKSIEELLVEYSPNNDQEYVGDEELRKIRNIRVHDVRTGKESRAYYIVEKSSNISFRHKGSYKKKPEMVYLKSFSEGVNEKFLSSTQPVGLERQSSLREVGPSVTRNAHLTAMLTFNESAEYLGLGKKFHSVADDFGSELKQLLTVASLGKEQLKIVIAIDEAASCPDLVRAIIRNSSSCVRTMLLQTLVNTGIIPDNSENLFDVKVSLGGTGVTSSDIGSFGDNYEVATPFREQEEGSL